MPEFPMLLSVWLLSEIPLLIHGGMMKSAPLLWAALGGCFSERSGVINIGLEGMMLIGAFAAVVGSALTGNPWFGLLTAIVFGAITGLLHAAISLYFKANQIVSGMGINLLALGITGVLLNKIFNTYGNSPEVPKISMLHLPFEIPFISEVFFPMSPLHLLLLFVLMLSMYILWKTRFGLRLRACGESPHVLNSVGGKPNLYRYIAVMLSGILAAIGGAQLSIGDISQFSTGMTNGRGFIALAALICSGWKPGRAALICILFGTTEALAERLQTSFPELPSRFLLALPFVIALMVLALSRQTNHPPASLGKV